MVENIIKEFSSITNNIEQIRIAMQETTILHWWNTQWFSSLTGAVVGAIAALTVGITRDYFSLRRKNLDNWYSHIVERQQPKHLFETAFITQYGHKVTQDGKTEVVPEKTFSEKVLIQFRRNYKYWNLPISRLRFLFWRYEKALSKLPHLNKQQLKESPEYLKAQQIFAKIIKLAERKTGENQWTIREP